jgi:hypothetical protein
VFPATIGLSRRSINIDGKDIPLSPGMSVSVEIRTGQRRAIDYCAIPAVGGSRDLRIRLGYLPRILNKLHVLAIDFVAHADCGVRSGTLAHGVAGMGSDSVRERTTRAIH